MKQRTYPQVWRDLTPDEKQDLAMRAETTYEYLKLIACRNGACGRHLADAITLALIDMGHLQGDAKSQRSVIFPQLKPAQLPTSSAIQAGA